MYEEKSFDQFRIGDKGDFAKTVTEADIVNFAGTSGDFNPLHINADYAEKTIFKGRIAHGALVGSFISAAGVSFVGLGAVYISQFTKFLAPVRIGDTITATMEVVEKIPEKKMLKLRTSCMNQHGKIVIDGEAVVKVAQ
ncbi:MAG: MaoC family dehydratase [Negativicutes bacterium]|nr:MaoC family dehydratase [Negativicutes bacterium]